MPRPSREFSEPSLTQQAYDRIKRGILDLTYAPGADLTEARLAESFAMSRMPVRSALKRLENEGWLEADFRKKTKVKRIFRQDVEDVFQLRRLLELPAIDLIFEQGLTWEYSFLIEEGLVRIRACRDDLYQRERAETDLHMAIINVYNNQRIQRIYQNAQDELIRIGLSFVAREQMSGDYIEGVISGWGEIIMALREQRKDDVIAIFDRDHLSGARELALKHLAEWED